MGIWRVNNSTLLGGEVCAQWQADHSYSLGARCVCALDYATPARAVVFECTTAGTSDSSEPTWDTTVTNTTNDNTVVWTTRSPDDGNWDNATCLLTYITQTADSLGTDDVYIDDSHAENVSAIAVIYAIYGSNDVTDFRKIYCVDKSDDSLSSGAVVQFSRGTSYYINIGGFLYSYGVTYRCTGDIRIYNNSIGSCIILESDSNDVLTLDGAGVFITLGSSSLRSQVLKIINGNINFQLITQQIKLNSGHLFNWNGGTFVAPNGVGGMIDDALAYGIREAIFRDVDLSAIGAGATSTSLIDADGPNVNILFERCKIPNDAGFSVISGTLGFDYPKNGTIRLHHCSASNNTYELHETSFEGTIDSETSIYRDDGFVHDATNLSLKMISTAKTIDRVNALASTQIDSWTDSTSSVTFTIEGIWDSATNIQNDEIWMELEYPANNTDGLGNIETDRVAQLSTPADQESSSEAWTGTGGMSNENKFKLSVTVTLGKAGPITARVYLAKPSTTVYIDPMVTES